MCFDLFLLFSELAKLERDTVKYFIAIFIWNHTERHSNTAEQNDCECD